MTQAPRSDHGHSLRVFISSASGALAPYRTAAVNACYRLSMTPVFMEEFDPERPPPLDVCRQKVADCDVFVLLLAHRYGARPPGEKLSYTELEYKWAVAHPEIQVMAYVLDDPKIPWPLSDVDQGRDAAALRAFKELVKSRHTVRRFTDDPRAFKEDLLIALPRVIPAALAAQALAGRQPRGRHDLPSAPNFYAVPPYVGSAPFTGRIDDLAQLDTWGSSDDPVMVVEAIGGTGKSALTWEWAMSRAEAAIGGLAGRMWWSFYDRSPSVTSFLREFLRYASGGPTEEIAQLDPAALTDEVMGQLRGKPYLIVLDGFERLLAGYHRLDLDTLRDDEVQPQARSLIEANADDFVRRLPAGGPSKILISSRLMPDALESQFRGDLPGVRHARLPGLTDADVITLLDRLRVKGSDRAVIRFFGSLGNHPLLVGVVAGLVGRYRPAPGDFDRWLADPAAGGALSVPALDLRQRRTHILAAGFNGLDPDSRQVLGWISQLAWAVSWDTLTAINPLTPKPPAPVVPDLGSPGRKPARSRFRVPRWMEDPEVSVMESFRLLWAEDASEPRGVTDRDFPAWSPSTPTSTAALRAQARLAAALEDLEDRGLLWWDRRLNTYNLHPIIRAFASDQLEDADRVRANDRVRDHFQSLPPEPLDRVSSVDDLTQTITIFRALVGAGHFEEANDLWLEFGGKLLADLGAYSTVVEFLEPLESRATIAMRNSLAIAFRGLGQYDRAIQLQEACLRTALSHKSFNSVHACIHNLSVYFRDIGKLAKQSRCTILREGLLTAAGAADGYLFLVQATHAILSGQADIADSLLDQAEGAGSPPLSGWFDDDLRYWRLLLAFEASRDLTHDQVDEAISKARTSRGHTALTGLRRDLCVREERFREALAAAVEYDRLCRKAGLDDAPAATAYILAKLDRIEDASAAVDAVLARLPRIHPARYPRYYLALSLRELGRDDEAVTQARAAYQAAWADGPPNYLHWDLLRARDLLESMHEALPGPPVADPATVKAPLEDEVLTYIAKLDVARHAGF